ncbi:hypothetical protein CDV31_002815 [Fusarium ambrosium]|uniref:Uncharacterized protein n=1 Tax=Fusarium ambrosium TaxID=131363 RepID=A0A428UVL9_9HYPO|nr:hypothetical protein CDV31_002815 [Fusarium ambrosium]
MIKQAHANPLVIHDSSPRRADSWPRRHVVITSVFDLARESPVVDHALKRFVDVERVDFWSGGFSHDDAVQITSGWTSEPDHVVPIQLIIWILTEQSPYR